MEYYSVIKKEEKFAICNSKDDGPWGYYAKWNNAKKDKYDFTHTKNITKKTKNQQIKTNMEPQPTE